jgi:hypothetical protein
VIADLHVLMALQALWKRIATLEANFTGVFACKKVPQQQVAEWRNTFCPGGDGSRLLIDEAEAHGRTRPPALLVELGSHEELPDRMLGEGRIGKSASTSLYRSQVAITCWGAQKSDVRGLSILTVAMLRYAHPYFRSRGYVGQQYVRGQDLTGWEELGGERMGNFKRKIIWQLDREDRLPPLLGDEPIETTIVAHCEDATDLEGNPGQVSPREVI